MKHRSNKMKLTFLVFFGLMLQTSLFAQTQFNVPENVTQTAKEDYAKYETDIVNASKWLEETPLDQEREKRSKIAAFVIKWVTGCPNFNMELTPPLQKIYDKNTDLLLIYMASYSRHFIVNKTAATKFGAAKEALTSMMNVYKKGIDIKKSKEMNKLIKADEEGKMDEYMHEKLVSLFWEEAIKAGMSGK